MATTDQQVRRLKRLMHTEKNMDIAASKAGMCRNTASKYLSSGMLPSQYNRERTWRTRPDPFAEAETEIFELLDLNPGLEAKTVFEHLQRKYPGMFADGQLRTFQSKIKRWRATQGPENEVMFTQEHYPGQLSASDYTHMDELGVTISGTVFAHMIYHFVLTYSNWETGTICFSENFESFQEGFQNAVWQLGGVTPEHLTDCMSLAVKEAGGSDEYTERYQALLRHYNVRARHTNPSSPHENGDIESRNNRFKRAVGQALMLRGSRDFASREEYADFLKKLFEQLNSNRNERFIQEVNVLKELPARRLDDYELIRCKVRSGSTVTIRRNIYSVNSRLIGQNVKVRLYSQHLEVYYGNRCQEKIPRLRGAHKHCINYRHVIHSLLSKPGAFANYRYRDDMFPTVRFRQAYDYLKQHNPLHASKEYVRILALAATESETKTDAVLHQLLGSDQELNFEIVRRLVMHRQEVPPVTELAEISVDIQDYDQLYDTQEVKA